MFFFLASVILRWLASQGGVIVKAAKVVDLETRLGKNFQNSSQLPSSDAFGKRAPRSLRRAAGRESGCTFSRRFAAPGAGATVAQRLLPLTAYASSVALRNAPTPALARAGPRR